MKNAEDYIKLCGLAYVVFVHSKQGGVVSHIMSNHYYNIIKLCP